MSKKALLIGNQDYEGCDFNKLTLPRNDVKQLKKTLEIIGFNVFDKYDLKYKDMKESIEQFIDDIQDGDEIIFYFSGHGYSYKANNYILPIDCLDIIKINYLDVFNSSYSEAAKVVDISSIVNKLQFNNKGVNILLLDACRTEYENKEYENEKISYFTELSTYKGNFFISYATALGNLSYENKEAKCSVYVDGICNVIYRKGQTLEEMFQCVRNFVNFNVVHKKSDSKQAPCYLNSINRPYSLINDENYTFKIEKKYFEDFCNIYKYLLNCYPKDDIDEEKKFSELLEFAELGFFYPQKILEKYVKKVIKSIEVKLGIIYFLLEDENITDVDVFSNRLFIKSNFHESITLYNYSKEYYNFDDCIEFIKSLEVKNKEAIYTIYYYRKRNIILINGATELSFQIIGDSKNIRLDRLIYPSIQSICKIDESKKIKDIIIKYIKNNKNIVVLGSFDTRKEEMISAFSDYFNPNDKILNIYEDININIRDGQVNSLSTDIDSIIKKNNNEFKYYINNIRSKHFGRIIYARKNFRAEKEILEELLKINDSQLIIYIDYINGFLNEGLDKISTSNIKFVVSKADLVIYLKKIPAIKSDIIEYVYERINGKLYCSVKEEVDYEKLDKILEKRLDKCHI
ncbi:TPA: caspase family protein [Clostridium botulinum]|nr:caspase family protein [Clostridium botulinum]